MENKNSNQPSTDSTQPSEQARGRQEKSDPQLTELRGFTDSGEDLEPTLTDGSKAPDKAREENRQNNNGA